MSLVGGPPGQSSCASLARRGGPAIRHRRADPFGAGEVANATVGERCRSDPRACPCESTHMIGERRRRSVDLAAIKPRGPPVSASTTWRVRARPGRQPSGRPAWICSGSAVAIAAAETGATRGRSAAWATEHDSRWAPSGAQRGNRKRRARRRRGRRPIRFAGGRRGRRARLSAGALVIAGVAPVSAATGGCRTSIVPCSRLLVTATPSTLRNTSLGPTRPRRCLDGCQRGGLAVDHVRVLPLSSTRTARHRAARKKSCRGGRYTSDR